MNFKPHNWNVIILGFWNKAILTPNFVAKNIFKTKDGTPFQVEIPVDLLLPPRIKYNDFVCSVDNKQIVVETNNCTTDKIIEALKFAKNAIEELPVTPVLAAGFNIRYEIEAFNPNLLKLIFGSDIDSAFSKLGYEVINRNVIRTVKFKDGIINTYFNYINNDKFEFQINFEKESKNPDDLKAWLSISLGEINEEISKIMKLFEEGFYE